MPYIPCYSDELNILGMLSMVALYNTQEQARTICIAPLKTNIESLYVPSER